MSTINLLQDSFLNQLQKEKIPVSVFLVNGIKLHGVIDACDEHIIMLKNSITQMVYKHAVSTVVPSRLIKYIPGEGRENMAD